MTDTKETSDLHKLHSNTNAHLWAEEFCKRFTMALSEVPGHEGVISGEDFEGTMIGWFANAIMAGVDGEARKHSDLAAALILAKEALGKIIPMDRIHGLTPDSGGRQIWHDGERGAVARAALDAINKLEVK